MAMLNNQMVSYLISSMEVPVMSHGFPSWNLAEQTPQHLSGLVGQDQDLMHDFQDAFIWLGHEDPNGFI
jgi:hypothetical protein